MLESDYSLALSINLSGIPSQIQKGASERCLLFRDDISPILCTRNERVFSFPPATLTATAVSLLLVRQLHYSIRAKIQNSLGVGGI